MGNCKSSSSLEVPQLLNNQEEIMIMCSVSEMVRQFLKENALIWYDPNIHSSNYITYINELKNNYNVQVFEDWKEASTYLKGTQLSCFRVITSEANGELFVKDISHLSKVASIYVFCSNINSNQTWASQYPKIECVEDNFNCLLDKIKESMMAWQRKSSSLKTDLPNFAPIFDDTDLSDVNYLNFYLQGLVNFMNKEQAKKDFVMLAKELYQNKKDIEDFEKNYNQYDMKAILNWYSKDCFLHKLTNNCLRIAKPDSIQYCRLILKDLENAIKDKYQQSSHKFSGLVYRGAYLPETEWTRLQQNISREIEMHGFLSTTKSQSVAIAFCQEDIGQKAMITIIVPNIPDKKVQGFAEMKEYSDFADEDEVLFNVRSRFTILEASLEEIDGTKIRHLVLLYGAQAIRRFTAVNKPSVAIKINNFQTMQCKGCGLKINIKSESILGVNIVGNQEYLCKDCLQKPHLTDKSVFLCVSPSVKNMTLKIEGTVIQYQNNISIPFYGYKCAVCQRTKLNHYYKCLDCKDAKMHYCNGCFNNKNSNSCIKKEHMMIREGYPFCFWSEKMSESELHRVEYQEEEIKQCNHFLQQGMIFYQTHNYTKATEYFQKYLERNGELKNFQTAFAHHVIGLAFKGMGEYQKALESHSKALSIYKSIFGDKHSFTGEAYRNLGNALSNMGHYQKAEENHSKALKIYKVEHGDQHSDTGGAYNDLGSTFLSSGEYWKAVENFSKALEIRKTVLGDKHPNTGESYNNLGLAFFRLGEYQKALENHSKASDIYKSVFGDKHPNMGEIYNCLGLTFNRLGESQKALENHYKALEIRKAVLGEKHPNTGDSYNNLGNTLLGLREHEKTVEYCSKALEIYKEAFEEKHSRIGEAYNNLGLGYFHLKEYQKATECHSKALEIKIVSLGENHSSTANSYNNLGNIFYALGEYPKAIEYHSKALEIKKTVLGDNHSVTGDSYNNLGAAFYCSGKYQKAIDYFYKALTIFEATLGDNHPNTKRVHQILQDLVSSKQIL